MMMSPSRREESAGSFAEGSMRGTVGLGGFGFGVFSFGVGSAIMMPMVGMRGGLIVGGGASSPGRRVCSPSVGAFVVAMEQVVFFADWFCVGSGSGTPARGTGCSVPLAVMVAAISAAATAENFGSEGSR